MTTTTCAKRQYRVTFTIEQDVTVEEPVKRANRFDWELEAETKAERLFRHHIEDVGADLEASVTKVKWLRPIRPRKRKVRRG